MFVFAIGSRHSGTRLLARLLYSSDFFMDVIHYAGEPFQMNALQYLAGLSLKSVQRIDKNNWNIDELFEPHLPDIIYEKLGGFFLKSSNLFNWEKVAVKYPDALFFLPWLVRVMPDAYFLEIVRDPRDFIRGSFVRGHDFEMPPFEEDVQDPNLHHARVLLYQFRMVQRVKMEFPNFKHLCIRCEDLVCNHEETVEKIETFLQRSLSRIPLDPSRMHKWINGVGDESLNYPFLQEILETWNYPLNR